MNWVRPLDYSILISIGEKTHIIIVPLTPPLFVIITLVSKACCSSSASTDNSSAVVFSDFKLLSITLEPPFVFSIFSSNSILPKCRTAATTE